MTVRRVLFVGLMHAALAAGLIFAPAAVAPAMAGTSGYSYEPPASGPAKKFLDGGASDLITKSQPSIDLNLAFEDQSADITPETAAELMKLGKALSDKNMKGNIYLIAAYTDASEDQDVSQALSEQRAAAVKAFLHDRFGIANDRLVTVGYGSSKLKNTTDPLAPENNRIEIINLGKNPKAQKDALPVSPSLPTPAR